GGTPAVGMGDDTAAAWRYSSQAQTPAILNHSRALPQRDRRVGPALVRGVIGGACDLVVLDAGDVLDDAFAVRGPGVYAETEVRSRCHLHPLHSVSASRFTAGGYLIGNTLRMVGQSAPITRTSKREHCRRRASAHHGRMAKRSFSRGTYRRYARAVRPPHARVGGESCHVLSMGNPDHSRPSD